MGKGPGSGPGAPKVFDAKRQALALDALRRGRTRTAAAGAAGVSYDTLSREVANNADFCGAVKSAEAEAVIVAEDIAMPWPPNTKEDARYWMQRRRREDWSEQQNVKHSGDEDAPLVFDWRRALGIVGEDAGGDSEAGSDGDSGTPGADQGSGDGAAVGKDGNGRKPRSRSSKARG